MNDTTEEFADRLFRSGPGAVEVLTIHLGDRQGWYRALAEGGPATADELVDRAGGAPRYARGEREQQASFGILTVAEVLPIDDFGCWRFYQLV